LLSSLLQDINTIAIRVAIIRNPKNFFILINFKG
jgi:hypothetical protein